jgi:hypothetical protein
MLHDLNEGTKRTAKRLQQASRTVTQNPTMEESTLTNANGNGSQASILHQDTIPLYEMEEETAHSQAGMTDSGFTTTSSSSSSTNVRPPNRKKQRSVHDALEQLTLDTSVSISTDTEHATTAISPSSRETQSPAATEVPAPPPMHMDFDDHNSSMDSASPDLDAQYKSSRDPDGSENG